MPQENYDFSGYATRANVVCSDGRVIDPQAFKHMDGKTVPLLWHHNFQDPQYVLGNARLEWREDGIYTYASLNGSPKATETSELLKHSDVGAFSVHGYNLVQDASQRVLKGDIKEVSIVISGANPGAKIEDVFLHTDMGATLIEDEAYFTFDTEFKHADTQTKPSTVGEALNSMNDTQKKAFHTLISATARAAEGEKISSEEAYAEYGGEEAFLKIMQSLTPEQLTAVQQSVVDIVESIAEENNDGDENNEGEMTHSDMGEGETMPKTIERNLFEGVTTNSQTQANTMTLIHADMIKVITAARERRTSVKAIISEMKNTEFLHSDLVVDPESLNKGEITTMMHADTSSLGNPEVLFPEAMLFNNIPKEMTKQYDKWVSATLAGVSKLPYSRVKTLFSDVTYETARAKGYIKGSVKKNDFYKWSKRVTQPTTVYKKEMMDRDDMIDISKTLDIVIYLKAIMRKKMDYELARAIVFGDGRALDDEDKINEDCIRPMITDEELFVTQTEVTFPAEDSDYNYVRTLEKALLMSKVMFNGTGTPVLYLSPFATPRIVLAEDKQGHYLYDNAAKFLNRTKISDILETTIMDDLYLDEAKTKKVVAVMTSLQDYHTGTDKGGSLAMFDDFDIDHNQHKYLLETRLSGAATQPKSTVVLYQTVTPPTEAQG